jgi:hypothetical protein
MKNLVILSIALVALTACASDTLKTQRTIQLSAPLHPMASALCGDAKNYTATTTATARQAALLELPALRRFAAACTNPPPGLNFVCYGGKNIGITFAGQCASTWAGSVIHGWSYCSDYAGICGGLGGTFVLL